MDRKSGGGIISYNEARTIVTEYLRREKMARQIEKFFERELEKTYIKRNDYFGLDTGMRN